ncbi:hypothetical protein [Agrobacterium cavarae]
MSMNTISIGQSVTVIADRIQRRFERKTSTNNALSSEAESDWLTS